MNKLSPDILEEQRLAALNTYDVLGEGLEEELKSLVKLAAQIANTENACITFLGKDTIINKATYGVEVDKKVFPSDGSIVSFLTSTNRNSYLILTDLKNNKSFSESPILKYVPSADFCAGFPIVSPDNFILGGLFLVDPKPNSLSEHQISALQTLVEQIITHLNLRKKNKLIAEQSNSLEEFVNVFEASPEIHSILDREGKILFLNSAATNVFGYKTESVIGKAMWQFCYKEDRQNVLLTLEKGLIKGKKQFSIDFRMLDHHYQIKWLSWNLVSKNNRWYCYGRDITEKKRIDNQLSNLSFVASRVNNAVVISDSLNRVGWINDAFTKITGYTLADVQGKPLGDLLSGPDTDWSVIEKARNAIHNKEAFTVELLGYRKDGKQIWLSIHSTIILDRDGEVETEIEIIIDITEKKKVEEELFVLSTVASKTNTGVLIYDREMRITWANKAAEKLTGYSVSEMSGKIPLEIFPLLSDNHKILEKTKQLQLIDKKPFELELCIKNKTEKEQWFSISNTPILDKNGNIERFIELATDITSRKKFEADIINAKEQAVQLAQAKEMFLSVMSHELRTPLNAVIGMTHLLLDSDPKLSQIDDLNILKFSGENLLRIINDVLDFSKIETGNLQLEKIPVNIKSLSTDIVNSLQIEAVKRQNQLKLQIDDTIPNEVLSDKTRLYQILMNLLGNAIKFTQKGTIDLLIDKVNEDKQTVELLFQIKDTGIGIAKDKQTYIFESFTQAKGDISRKYGGTGLGLAITKRLVKLFGTDIKVASEEGKGSNFYFQIKLPKVEKATETKPKTVQFNGKRILIVDDNRVNILIAERILAKWGLSIDFVIDGYQAIEQISKKKYDLIFMDIHMPGIDGYETTIIIRGSDDKYQQNVPIIALTASTLDSNFHKFKECGMNGYALKPFNPVEIKKILNEFLNK